MHMHKQALERQGSCHANCVCDVKWIEGAQVKATVLNFVRVDTAGCIAALINSSCKGKVMDEPRWRCVVCVVLAAGTRVPVLEMAWSRLKILSACFCITMTSNFMEWPFHHAIPVSYNTLASSPGQGTRLSSYTTSAYTLVAVIYAVRGGLQSSVVKIAPPFPNHP